MRDITAVIVDEWSDEELSERCICGHTLGQHEFGCETSPCDERLRECNCYRFQPQNAYTDAWAVAEASAQRDRRRRPDASGITSSALSRSSPLAP